MPISIQPRVAQDVPDAEAPVGAACFFTSCGLAAAHSDRATAVCDHDGSRLACMRSVMSSLPLKTPAAGLIPTPHDLSPV